MALGPSTKRMLATTRRGICTAPAGGWAEPIRSDDLLFPLAAFIGAPVAPPGDALAPMPPAPGERVPPACAGAAPPPDTTDRSSAGVVAALTRMLPIASASCQYSRA